MLKFAPAELGYEHFSNPAQCAGELLLLTIVPRQRIIINDVASCSIWAVCAQRPGRVAPDWQPRRLSRGTDESDASMGLMGDRWPAAGVPDALWFVVLLVALLAVRWLRSCSPLGGKGTRTTRRSANGPTRCCGTATRGEIGWQAYREALVNLLKDRYIRDEISLDEYQIRLSELPWRRICPRAGGSGLAPA